MAVRLFFFSRLCDIYKLLLWSITLEGRTFCLIICYLFWSCWCWRHYVITKFMLWDLIVCWVIRFDLFSSATSLHKGNMWWHVFKLLHVLSNLCYRVGLCCVYMNPMCKVVLNLYFSVLGLLGCYTHRRTCRLIIWTINTDIWINPGLGTIERGNILVLTYTYDIQSIVDTLNPNEIGGS